MPDGGQLFLADIPDKVAVIVHRRYSEGVLARLRKEWLACGERGGVLVSAAISAKEKEVLREAYEPGVSYRTFEGEWFSEIV